MATKSFLKTVTVCDNEMGKNFVNALTKSNRAKEKKTEYKRACEKMERKDIKGFFDNF